MVVKSLSKNSHSTKKSQPGVKAHQVRKPEPPLVAMMQTERVEPKSPEVEARCQRLKEYMQQVLEDRVAADPSYSKAQLVRDSGISINSVVRYFSGNFDPKNINSRNIERLADLQGRFPLELKCYLLGQTYSEEMRRQADRDLTPEEREREERCDRLSQYIKEELKARRDVNPDFTQQELAREYKLNTSTLSKYVRGDTDPWAIGSYHIRQLARMRGWTEVQLRAYIDNKPVEVRPPEFEKAWVAQATRVSADELKKVGEIAASRLSVKQLSYLAQMYLVTVNQKINDSDSQVLEDEELAEVANNQPLVELIEAKRLELEAEDGAVWRSLLKAFRLSEQEMKIVYDGKYVDNSIVPKLAKLLDLTGDEVMAVRDGHPEAPRYQSNDESGNGSKAEPQSNGSSK